MEELINYLIESDSLRKEEVLGTSMKIAYLKADHSRQFTSEDQKMIASFWELCLKKTVDVPEYKLMVEYNEAMLKEAEAILPELIKRIEKTIEA